MNRRSLEIAAGLVAMCAAGAMLSQLPGARGLLLRDGMPFFGDFIAFWSGGWLVLQGRVEEVHTARALWEAHHAAIPELQRLFPWRSPPTFLLLAVPLAALPFPIAAILFLALSFALYVVGCILLSRDRRFILFALLAPGALLHVGSSQLGVMIAGFTALALALLDRRPVLAGAFISLIIFKPHLGVIWPLFLGATGRWRAFLSASAGVVALGLVAGVLFGFDAYWRFAVDLGVAQSFVDERRLPGQTLASLYANLLYLGASPALALGSHAASAAASLWAAVRIWRQGDSAASAAALVGATLLFSPYLFFYDAVLLVVGVAALSRTALTRAQIVVLIFAVIAPGLSLLTGMAATLPLCPLAAWGLLWAAAHVRRSESALSLQAR